MKARRVGARARARRPSRARLQEERAKSASVAIASSLFLVLIAAALLVGGHAAIGQLLRSAIAARDAKGIRRYRLHDARRGILPSHVF